MQILLYTLLTFHIMVCLLMVLVVLMQRPRSEGLGAAFGSGMTENIFGAQTTHVLAKFTTWLGGLFFVLTLALAMVYARMHSGQTAIGRELSALPAPAPAASASPTPTPVGEPLPAQPAATVAPEAAAPAPAGTAAPTGAPAESFAPAAPNAPVEATPAAN